MIHFDVLPPWELFASTDQAVAFARELGKECASDHPLHGLDAVALAHRSDCDDVLFAFPGAGKFVAVVHLTWSGNAEPDPDWPTVRRFPSLDTWRTEGMEQDHREWRQDAF